MAHYTGRILLGFILFPFVVSVSVGNEALSGTNPPVKEILSRFDEGNPGWKVRMKSLVRLANVGSDAVPVLVRSLHNGSPLRREFAAQALAMILHPASRSALEKLALSGDKSGARNYAIRALSMMGGVALSAQQKHEMRNRSYDVAALLRKKLPPEAKSLRQSLTNYNLARLDSAQLGKLAPDFVLTEARGKTYRLSEFHGKKRVLLEFNAAYS